MTDENQPAGDGPAEHLKAAVFLTGLAGGMVAGVWTGAGEALGAGGGIVLGVVAGMVLQQAVNRAGRYLSAREKSGRAEAERLERESARVRQEACTGWWVTPAGDLALVRYDPVIDRFLLDGRVWPDAEVLRQYMRFCERFEGWSPLGDEPTVWVRERLGLSS